MFASTHGTVRRAAAMTLPVLAAGLLGLPAPASASTNLAPNPCFQLAVTEGSVNGQQGPLHGLVIQPGLPDGWIFEGSAGFFDYADVRADVIGLGGRTRTCGALPRLLAISSAASGKPSVCDAGPCVGLEPVSDAKKTAARAYTVDPAWRTTLPIAVSGGTYNFKVDIEHESVSVGSGAFFGVRWLDANGGPLGFVRHEVPKLETDSNKVRWERFNWDFTAPDSAHQAVLFLGHMEDVSAGQVRFDNVCFQAGSNACT